MVPGIRNNNPFNIRISTTPWQGKLSPERNTDGRFEQFQTALAGIRAGMRNTLTHYRKYGCNTVAKLIAKHAPPNENDTAKYIAFVARGLGVDAGSVIDLTDVDQLVAYSRAVIRYECGEQPYTQALLQQAARAALGV